MKENGIIQIGENAPEFILKDHNGNQIKLADFKGKNVLLSFHPLAWTQICADQMKSLESNYDRFENLNTVPLGLSVDSVPCKKAWADELGISKTSLLADFWSHGGVAHAFGIFRDKDGLSERANIILDENQKIVFVKVYPMSELPNIEEIFAFLEKKKR